MLRFPPKCPRSHSPTTFPPIWSFLLCFLPVIIFIYFLAPPHHFSSVFGLRTVIPPILLPAPRPERHLCICTHEAGAQGEAAPGAGEHGNAQVVRTHGGGCAHAGMHRGWVHMRASTLVLAANLGLGACPEPSTPVFTVMFSHFMLVMPFTCWSEQAHHEQDVQPT